jgi:hypothetical protein
MAKLSIADRNAKARIPIRPVQSHTLESRQPQVDDVASPAFASSSRSSCGAHPVTPSPPTSPQISQTSPLPVATAGGEMERIRQAMMHDRLAHHRETESRRPDYLTRAKRTLTEADPAILLEDESAHEGERLAAVGITESPVKGRRLKLFQETSEESFEESLMAGGYGRYVRSLEVISLALINRHAAYCRMGSSTPALNIGSSRSSWTFECRLCPRRS